MSYQQDISSIHHIYAIFIRYTHSVSPSDAPQPNLSPKLPSSKRVGMPEMSFRKVLLDLFFTLLLPIAILNPNLLGEGIGVSDFLGKNGNINAYLMASLIPVVYVIWDIVILKNISMIALLGGASALMGGALTFWYVDGFWYAIKDSARSYISGLIFIVSAFTYYPLMRLFTEPLLSSTEENTPSPVQILSRPAIRKSLISGSIAFGIIDIIGGIVNSAANYKYVIAKFGTDEFNAQIAQVNALMRLPNLIISLLGIAAAFYIINAAIKKEYGEDASLFNPASIRESNDQESTD